MINVKRFVTCAGALMFAALAMMGCDSLRDKAFGSAESLLQQSYRAHLIYEGLATLAKAEPEFQAIDLRARASVASFHQAIELKLDLVAPRAAVRSDLRKYAAAIAGRSGISVTGLSAEAALVSMALKLPGAGKELVAIRREVTMLSESGRDPTDEEWTALFESVDQLHRRNQGAD